MKVHVKITPPHGMPPYLLRISGENILLKTTGGQPVALSYITDKPAELEFSLADAEDVDQAVAAVKAYTYPTWEVEVWNPVKA